MMDRDINFVQHRSMSKANKTHVPLKIQQKKNNDYKIGTGVFIEKALSAKIRVVLVFGRVGVMQ